MDELRSWATTACLAALAAGIAGIIAPSGKFEKVYKFAVSLFFLCCLLTPLFSMKSINLKSFDLSDSQQSSATVSMQSTVNSQAQQIAEQNIKKLISSCCKDCGVTPLNITVNTDLKSSKISVRSAVIVLKQADINKQSKIRDEINNKIGISAVIKEGEK